MIVCFLGYLLAVSVFFTTFVHKIYVVLKMEKVYAHREFGLEANIIGCATYEIKTQPFEPSFLGQLSGYVSCANHILKGEGDNPTIGLLICKNKDAVMARYALEGYNQPLGISEYELSKVFPENFKSSLPSIEDIENELKEK